MPGAEGLRRVVGEDDRCAGTNCQRNRRGVDTPERFIGIVARVIRPPTRDDLHRKRFVGGNSDRGQHVDGKLDNRVSFVEGSQLWARSSLLEEQCKVNRTIGGEDPEPPNDARSADRCQSLRQRTLQARSLDAQPGGAGSDSKMSGDRRVDRKPNGQVLFGDGGNQLCGRATSKSGIDTGLGHDLHPVGASGA